jgi:hypothetical protein
VALGVHLCCRSCYTALPGSWVCPDCRLESPPHASACRTSGCAGTAARGRPLDLQGRDKDICTRVKGPLHRYKASRSVAAPRPPSAFVAVATAPPVPPPSAGPHASSDLAAFALKAAAHIAARTFHISSALPRTQVLPPVDVAGAIAALLHPDSAPAPAEHQAFAAGPLQAFARELPNDLARFANSCGVPRPSPNAVAAVLRCIADIRSALPDDPPPAPPTPAPPVTLPTAHLAAVVPSFILPACVTGSTTCPFLLSEPHLSQLTQTL